MNLSYLAYSTYRRCPLQYKWKFVERPPVKITFDKRNAFIGLLLQRLVERFYKESWWHDKDGVIKRFRNAIPLTAQQFTDSEKIKWREGELEDWLKVAHDTIEPIIKIIKAEKLLGEENYAELEVEHALGEHVLQARIDLLVKRKGVYTLLDGKGGKTVGRYVDKDQLYFYAAAARRHIKRLPHRMGLWWFRHGRIVWFPVLSDTVADVEARAGQAIQGILGGHWDPTPSADCRVCDFRVCCSAGQKYISSRAVHSEVELPGNLGEVDLNAV